MVTGPRQYQDPLHGSQYSTGPLAQIDDATLDRFMVEIDRHIDERIAQAQPPPASARRESGGGGAAGVIAVGIPFVVLAGAFGHHAGAILAVLVTGAVAFGQLLRGK